MKQIKIAPGKKGRQAVQRSNVQIPRILQNAQRLIVVFGTAPKTARTITSKRHAAAHTQNELWQKVDASKQRNARPSGKCWRVIG